jgi:preprotein translocase subunit SecE
MTDKTKISLAIALFVMACSTYFLPANLLPADPRTSELTRMLGLLGGIGLAAAVFWFTQHRLDFFELVKQAKVELLKVVWPTRPETTQYTITVVVFALAVALFCWIVDKGIEWVLYDWILRIN